MFCTNCGAQLEDDAKFCTDCGSPVDESQETPTQASSDSAADNVVPAADTPPVEQDPVMAGSSIVESSYTAPEGVIPAINQPVLYNTEPQAQEPSKKQGSQKPLIIGICVALIAILIGIVAVFFIQNQQAHKPTPITINLTASGYVEDGSSGVPITITGIDLDGNSVNEKILLKGADTQPELLRGEYDIAIVGYPVSGNGQVYNYNPQPISLVIDEHGQSIINEADTDTSVAPSESSDNETTESDEDSQTTDGEANIDFTLVSIPADQLTDEQIESIKDWMIDYDISQGEMDNYITLVTETRDNEIKRIAEEKARQLTEAAFGSFPEDFTFMSGVGGWLSGITIEKDGTFTGNWHDSDMGMTGPGYPKGILSSCDFKGKFTVVEQVNSKEFLLQLDYLRPTHSKGTEYKDGMRIDYYDDEPYGLGKMTESPVGGWHLYLPGTSMSVFNDLERGWLYYMKSSTTTSYVLANGEYAWQGK